MKALYQNSRLRPSIFCLLWEKPPIESGIAGLTTQEGTEACEHLANIERFEYAIVRADIENMHARLRIAGYVEGQYRHLVARLSRRSGQFESAAAHQAQIEQDNSIVSSADGEPAGARVA